ncbi:MAG TPA: methyltransferase [Polyangiaceae bacterium]|nr:methyltransferase [Polyangiaceae bacterium]
MKPAAELATPSASSSGSPTGSGIGATAILDLYYDADVAALSPRLRDRFVKLSRDAATDAFLEQAKRGRHSWWRTKLHHFLRQFMSDFDVNGLLDMYPLFVASTEHWRLLLGPQPVARLLDVGSGSGNVTQTLLSLAEHVVTTELSRNMAERLRRSGLECHEIDLAERDLPGKPFDLITCLNVLDRTSRPRQLLRRMHHHLNPGGRLLLALALPYNPFFFSGNTTPEPLERLACAEPSWEAAINALVERELEPLGFNVLTVSRTPYLSFGDSDSGLYELDDALLICEKSR